MAKDYSKVIMTEPYTPEQMCLVCKNRDKNRIPAPKDFCSWNQWLTWSELSQEEKYDLLSEPAMTVEEAKAEIYKHWPSTSKCEYDNLIMALKTMIRAAIRPKAIVQYNFNEKTGKTITTEYTCCSCMRQVLVTEKFCSNCGFELDWTQVLNRKE